jgi:hypothetical protein
LESQRIGPHENFAAHPGVAYPLDRGLKVKTYDVDYIFYGLAEQALGDYVLDGSSFLICILYTAGEGVGS